MGNLLIAAAVIGEAMFTLMAKIAVASYFRIGDFGVCFLVRFCFSAVCGH